MKRIALLAVALVLILSLCACSCSNQQTDGTGTSNPSTGTEIMPTENMTIPVPETNVPDNGVDNDTMPGGIPDGTNGFTNDPGNSTK